MNIFSFRTQSSLAASIALIILCAITTTANTSRANAPRTHSPTLPPTSVFNLTDFNPVADGVTDDGPALQRALDALHDAGGGTLLIPAGTYRIKTPVVKDFSTVAGANVLIQGVPSTKMPAPVTAPGNQLAEGLDLTSEIIPDTGALLNAITLSNLHQLTIEHVVFTGIETTATDAFVTIYLSDIDKATIRHCEFYGISTFGLVSGLGGGNVIRAVRSDLSVELSVFLGSTANSGAYAPLIENVEWRRFSISNAIFLDYGLRTFFSKTGLGAPLSWIGIESPAPATPDSPRREVIVRDVFLDEGGWVGISVLPYRWASPPEPIDLLYISGLKMNVSNLHMTGHLIFDVRNVFVENSHYGWSRNAYAAIDLNRVETAILDKLTCIDHANRLRTDDRTDRFTVINSLFQGLDSEATTVHVLETTPEQDPVQFVRAQFTSLLGRQPDPAAHFYWSDLLIKCGSNNACLTDTRAALSAYLSSNPSETFAIAGSVVDENGDSLSGVTIDLSGSQSLEVVTDAQGQFRFAGLPTSGNYNVTVAKRHYTFDTASQSLVHPAGDGEVVFHGRLNRHSIGGRIRRTDGMNLGGVVVQLAQTPAISTTTDANGVYEFPGLAAGNNYTVVPSLTDFAFAPANLTSQDLSEDRQVNFTGRRIVFALAGSVTDDKGVPLSDASINLSGSQTSSVVSDSQGHFEFIGLPASGSYTVTISKEHYSFTTSSQSFANPLDNVNLTFSARLNRHAITGRLTKSNGTGIGSVVVRLAQSPTITATTDANGFYSFPELLAGSDYTVIPVSSQLVFAPANVTFSDLSGDRAANFVGKLLPMMLIGEGSEFAVALDSMSFVQQPFSFFNPFAPVNGGLIRLMIFAQNVEPGSGPSQITVVARDDLNQTHPITVESVSEVPGLSWLRQVNVKLPANSLGGKCVRLTMTVAEVNSNDVRVCLGVVATSSN